MWLALVYSFLTTRPGLGGDDSPSAYTAVELSMLWMGSFGLASMKAYGWPKSALVLVLVLLWIHGLPYLLLAGLRVPLGHDVHDGLRPPRLHVLLLRTINIVVMIECADTHAI